MSIYELKGHEVRLGLFHEEEVRELKRSIEEEKERMRQREKPAENQYIPKDNRHCCEEYSKPGTNAWTVYLHHKY